MTSSFSELSKGPAFRVAGAAIGVWAASFAPRRGADLLGDHLAVRQHPFANAELRLGDKIHRPQLQRAQGDFRSFPGQGGDHHHRHGPQPH
jgi:hypothetical protein